MGNIFKLALSYSVIEGIQKGISFFTIPLLTYYITSKEYGNIAIVLMIISFFLIFFTFSLDATIMRYYVKIKNKRFKKTFLGTIYLSSLIFMFLWMIILFVTGPQLFEYFFPNLSFRPYIIFAMMITMFKLINMFYITFLKSIQDIKEYAKFYNIYFFIQTALILLFVIVFDSSKKDIMYLIGLLISQMLTLYYIHLKIKSEIYMKINIRILLIALNYALSIIPIKIVNIVNSSIDRYLLLYFIGSSAVGIYYLGLQLATAVQMVMLSINSAYLPKFYQLYERNKNSMDFSEVYTILNKIVLIAGIIEVVALQTYSIVFYFINSNYASAKPIVPILILYFSLAIVYFINTNILSISATLNRKKVYGILIGIVLNTVVSIALINTEGMVGVAIGTVVGFLTSIIYFIFLVRKHTKFDIHNYIYIIYMFFLFIVNYFISSFIVNLFLSVLIIGLYFKFVLDKSSKKVM